MSCFIPLQQEVTSMKALGCNGILVKVLQKSIFVMLSLALSLEELQGTEVLNLSLSLYEFGWEVFESGVFGCLSWFSGWLCPKQQSVDLQWTWVFGWILSTLQSSRLSSEPLVQTCACLCFGCFGTSKAWSVCISECHGFIVEIWRDLVFQPIQLWGLALEMASIAHNCVLAKEKLSSGNW